MPFYIDKIEQSGAKGTTGTVHFILWLVQDIFDSSTTLLFAIGNLVDAIHSKINLKNKLKWLDRKVLLN